MERDEFHRQADQLRGRIARMVGQHLGGNDDTSAAWLSAFAALDSARAYLRDVAADEPAGREALLVIGELPEPV